MTEPIEPAEGFEELPQPPARQPRRRLAVLGVVVAGGLAAGGAFALVSAAGAASTSGSASSSPAAGSSTSAANCAPGRPGGPGRLGAPPKLAAGDFDGTITNVSSTSVTVKGHDGTLRTYAITSNTTVHSGPGTTVKVSSLKKDQHVHIRGAKSGSTYTATDIGIAPKGRPFGPPHGGPGGWGRGPGHGTAPSGAPTAPSATPSTSTSS